MNIWQIITFGWKSKAILFVIWQKVAHFKENLKCSSKSAKENLNTFINIGQNFSWKISKAIHLVLSSIGKKYVFKENFSKMFIKVSNFPPNFGKAIHLKNSRSKTFIIQTFSKFFPFKTQFEYLANNHFWMKEQGYTFEVRLSTWQTFSKIFSI